MNWLDADPSNPGIVGINYVTIDQIGRIVSTVDQDNIRRRLHTDVNEAGSAGATASVASDKGHVARSCTDSWSLYSTNIQTVSLGPERWIDSALEVVLHQSFAQPIASPIPTHHSSVALAKINFRHQAAVIASLASATGEFEEWRFPAILTS